MKFITKKTFFAFFLLGCLFTLTLSISLGTESGTSRLSRKHKTLAGGDPSKEEQKNGANGTAITLETIIGHELNSTFTIKNPVDFQNKLRVPNLMLKDPQILEIYHIMSSAKNGKVTQEDMRSFYNLFIKNFDLCDTKKQNKITKEEFVKCMTSDVFLSKIQVPTESQVTNKNLTSKDEFPKILFEIYDENRNDALTFYDYLTLRLLRFSWDKCSVNAAILDEANFACAINAASGYKTLSHNSLNRLFGFAMEISGSRTTIDFVSFSHVALSLNLFGKINGKRDSEISQKELMIALEHGILPSRYNEDVVNEMFALIADDTISTKGIDMFSFVFYDYFLRIFDKPFIDGKDKANQLALTKEEFAEILKNNFYYLSSMKNEIFNIPFFEKIKPDSFSMSEEAKQKSELKNEGAFLTMIQKKDSFYALTTNSTNYKHDMETKANSIFEVLDYAAQGKINFLNFAHFVQVNYIFTKLDKLKKGRIAAGTLYQKLYSYYEFPLISSTIKQRSQKFSLFNPKIYFDLFNTFVVLKIDDVAQIYLRREGSMLLNEVEIKEIMIKIGYEAVPDDYLVPCLRGTNSRALPVYDWECTVIGAVRNMIDFHETQMDYIASKKYKMNLSHTEFKNEIKELA